jgi:hypothetical protein
VGVSFSLSLTAADILLEHLNLGRAPLPFEVPHIGTTFEQRAQVRDAVFRELGGRGLVAFGRPVGDVERMLRTFVTAPVAITAVAQMEEGKPLFARVVSDGEYAAETHQDANMLIFTEVRPTAIVPSVVDLLPSAPAAAGQSVTVAKPAPQRRSRNEDYDPFSAVSRPRASAGSAQTRMVERIFQKPKLRIGQFTTFVDGGRSLSPTVWFDTPDGRYFVTSRDAEDGQSWITYAPADEARLTRHLSAQLEGYLS